MANFKNLPISLKIGFLFFSLGLFLLSILLILLIPKIEKEQYNNALLQTEKMVLLTKTQIELVVNYFKEYAFYEKNESKIEIETKIDKIKTNSLLNKNYTTQNLQEDLKKLNNKFNCEINLIKDDKNILTLTNEKINEKFDFKNFSYDFWHNIDNSTTLCPHTTNYLFKTKIKNQELQLTCSSYFHNNHKNIEQNVKNIIQEGFSLSENIHKGKIYMMWLNKNIKNEDLEKSLDTIANEDNKNFCVSKISNYRMPKSGELTIEDILNVNETSNIKHKIDDKTTLTWISNIDENDNKKFVLVMSAYEEDFKNNLNNQITKILPISILALVISVLFGYFLFKRWIKNIETLSYTAKEVCLGKLNFRSNIKGNDDIGILGVAFDSMLDKIENNIKNLDFEVANRTEELSNSLKAKELLLQEIHHRVKNNLSLTINFIKLQKYKIKDKNIIDALTNIENRVYTMALLHTKLYESKNLDFIDFELYIIQLVNDIKSTFEEESNILIDINIKNIFLNIEQALPCGLIINETVVNALKYAFINKKGIIEISLKKENDYILEIKDNGKGLGKDFNIDELSSLGLNLVKSITTIQLNGSLEINQNLGTHLIIKFPL
ncbi:MAG: histidine kinase dimerization/phosphoacceptor domain -containing protein [Arcobacter sp.]|uniref:sensor histidine kinase n=1 Tax=Arcobacter sp. TaxID=1872629 RepID=UPI003CFF52B7